MNEVEQIIVKERQKKIKSVEGTHKIQMNTNTETLSDGRRKNFFGPDNYHIEDCRWREFKIVIWSDGEVSERTQLRNDHQCDASYFKWHVNFRDGAGDIVAQGNRYTKRVGPAGCYPGAPGYSSIRVSEIYNKQRVKDRFDDIKDITVEARPC